jgi:hypothetical protein
VVATIKGWPQYGPLFEEQRRAVESVGGEMIVVDGSGNAPPPENAIGAQTRWLSVPGEGVFQLRARAYDLVRAPIVAQTEDHCLVDEAWARAALQLHEEFPEASVIGGVVENGARDRLDDWAVFFIGHFRDIPGVGHGRRVQVAGVTNVTYKRHALEGLRQLGELGVNEAMHQRELSARGVTVLIDDRLRVVHIQSLGLKGMTAIAWHAARSAAAMRRERWTPLSAIRALATPLSPYVYLGFIAKAVARQRYQRKAFVASAPVVFALLGVRAAAELVGYVAGAGDSARRFN